MAECPFCERIAIGEVLFIGKSCALLHDAYPLSPGHCLIVPKRHVSSVFELEDAERSELFSLITNAKTLIEASYSPDGYNLGMNIGASAGQTIEHAHLHVIPRYSGDVEDPRGGVRNIIRSRARYWEKIP